MEATSNRLHIQNLDSFNPSGFDKGGNKLKQLIWLIINSIILKSSWIPFIGIKVFLLRMFGARIGRGLVIKPSVNIKFPWKLVIGDNVWIGENVWIDNLDKVEISNNVCISQGALLLTGNHDYSLSSFDYRNKPILLKEGVWVGAKSVVCPGVICASHSILAVGSIATKNLEPYKIYQGNPAKPIRNRVIHR